MPTWLTADPRTFQEWDGSNTPSHPATLDASGSISAYPLLDKGGQVYNVKAYGAKGDGTTDDTASIQSAVTACQAATGGVLFFPAGTYVVSPASTNVDLSTVTNQMAWQGTGAASVIQLSTAGSGTKNGIVNFANNTGLRFLDLKFYGAYTAGGSSLIFQGSGTLKDTRFERCVFRTDGSGVSAPYIANMAGAAAGSIEDLTFLNCRFENPNGTNPANGLLVRGFNGMKVIACTFVNINNPIVPDNIYAKKNLSFIGNEEIYTSLSQNWEGPDIMGVVGVTYTGNTQRATGITLVGGTDVGGVLIDAGGGFGCADVTVSGNFFLQNPIQVAPRTGAGNAISNVAIVGNAINGGRSTGAVNGCIVLQGDPAAASVNYVIEGNVCHGAFTGTSIQLGTGYTGVQVRSNVGFNPVGVVTPAVPASTVAVAAQPYDRTFYISTAAGVSTFAIQGGPTITIPASGFGTVRVPAGQTLIPTYANAPTWVVEGE